MEAAASLGTPDLDDDEANLLDMVYEVVVACSQGTEWVNLADFFELLTDLVQRVPSYLRCIEQTELEDLEGALGAWSPLVSWKQIRLAGK